MKIHLRNIQHFPYNLLSNNWLKWCESFLTEGINLQDYEFESFNIKNIKGIPDNSSAPTRAIELYRGGLLKYPISVNKSKTRAWDMLRNNESIISNFGFISYLIIKASESTENNQKLNKAFSAITSILAVSQTIHVDYDGENHVISLNTIFQRLIEIFKPELKDYLALQFLASAMICTLKWDVLNETFIRKILNNYSSLTMVITSNPKRGNEIIYNISKSNFNDILSDFRNNKRTFDNTTNQRFCNFYVGNNNNNPELGYINSSRKYFDKFLKDCSKIEIENWMMSPFKDLYRSENYSYDDIGAEDIIMQFKHIFNKYLPDSDNLKELLMSLKDGCFEAIKVLGWENNQNSNEINNNGENKIFYGAPGVGKSYHVNQILKNIPRNRVRRVTFHPEYDHASFVGCYRPEMDEKENIIYRFTPQAFTNIYCDAWNDPNNDYYLIIEEINRGNCAEIFGDIFQLLDRDAKYDIVPSKELGEYLDKYLNKSSMISSDALRLPNNLHIYATMNTSDQSLYPMDSAFKRRWIWNYIPINYLKDQTTNKSAKFKVQISENEFFNWIDFIKAVNDVIKRNSNLGQDKCIGNYFINPKDNIIDLATFIHKTVFYLWNDVFKDEMEDDTIFKNHETFTDFFPIEQNGKQKVIQLVKSLNIEIEYRNNIENTD